MSPYTPRLHPGDVGADDWDAFVARCAREQRIDSALQIGIAVLSIAAAWLVASTGPYAKWGFVIGLASQPLWFAATWRHKQYGMTLVTIFYCGAWMQGIANRFF